MAETPLPPDEPKASGAETGSPIPPPGGASRGERIRHRVGNAMLAVDAWLDTAMYRVFEGTVEGYRRLSVTMRAFRVRGPVRLAIEVAGDGLTLGIAGLIALLALALPALEVAKTDWRKNVDYAVTFLDRHGNEIGRRGVLQNVSVPVEEFPDHLIKALLATEDRRFFEHFGIDVVGTTRALVANMRQQQVKQGGSSLTQQLAKNLFLTNERSIERKIKEAFLALWLETHLSKREILKLYLDNAYMGGGTHGVAAASQFYFGKSVRDIDLAEAAMLAGLFKAPTNYAPHVNLPAARARANDVLSNLVAAGFYTEGQVMAARRHPATPVDRTRSYSPDYFLDYAFKAVQDMAPPEHTLTVRTTLDLGIQRKAEEAVENALRQNGEEYDVSQAAAVILSPDGAVRAMVGGREYGSSQFNRATDAARQPGSSFKPYVYMAALLAGKTPTSTVTDQPVCIGNWCPKNYGGGYFGRVTLLEAIARSLNSIPVQLAEQIGRDKVAAVVRTFGIDLPKKPDWPFVIGSVEVKMIEHAGGYATMASGGYRIRPTPLDQVASTANGTVLWDRARNARAPERVFPAEKVAELNSMLHNAVETGTGARAKLDGIPAGGKTGTTQSSRDAWFCGFTGNYIGLVWVGNDDYRPMERVTGGMIPAPIWHEIMAFAHQGVELRQAPGFPPPRRAGAVVAGVGAARPGLIEPSAATQADRPKPLSARAIGTIGEVTSRLKAAPRLEAVPAASPAGGLRSGALAPVTGRSGPRVAALSVLGGSADAR